MTTNADRAERKGEKRRTSLHDRLNVMLVSTPFRSSLGADTWVHIQIMRTLDRMTHRVHVGCVPRHLGASTAIGQVVEADDDLVLVALHPGPERPMAPGVKALAASALTLLPAMWSVVRLAWYIRRHDIRILHTTDRPRDALMCVLLSKFTRAKSIVHVHVLYADWMGRGLRWSIQHADARIAVSAFVKTSMTDAGISSESTHVVLNAVDVAELRPGAGAEAIRAEFGLEESQPLVITVCRLFAEKGPVELIRAIDVVRRSMPDVQLLIVGKDTDPSQTFRHHLEQLVDELDLQGHVRFTGRRPDVAALMAAADVFAMPSFEEPFGLVFAEAMAMETPVVALDNGGTREVVEHGRQGLLSEYGDLDGLVTNLSRLLADPDLRTRMGEDGRRRVLADFQIERMGDGVAAVYRLVTS